MADSKNNPYDPSQYIADKEAKEAKKPKTDEIKETFGDPDTCPSSPVQQCKAKSITLKSDKRGSLGLRGEKQTQERVVSDDGKKETVLSGVAAGPVIQANDMGEGLGLAKDTAKNAASAVGEKVKSGVAKAADFISGLFGD